MRSGSRAGNQRIGVGYLRVSTEEQNLGPEAQREAIEKWAVSNGVSIVGWFQDFGVSGGAGLDKRPGLLEAIDMMKESGAGVFIVAKRDRLARDTMFSAMIERLVERAGGKVLSADGVGNGDGPEAQLLRGIMDVFAQYERALIRCRTKAALAVKKGRNERVGSVPYGWRLSEDGKRLEPNKEEQNTIAHASRLREAGISLRRIGSELSGRGMVPRNGGDWNPKSVLSLLSAKAA